MPGKTIRNFVLPACHNILKECQSHSLERWVILNYFLQQFITAAFFSIE
ncbi:hypothetical protein QWZ08_06730 [Ferruginibacter paludis]|nr:MULTISPECIES: hypothetical protein [Ferruginibacter]MDB5276456.1 hypothetical protein [Ferruginibacter sp.]MDN3655310.1 hypothetical protein [Ferruginibacter paludis]